MVSAGGGMVGEPLLRAAIEAHQQLDKDVEMKVIAGPFFNDESWESLRLETRGKDRLRVIRHVSDLCGELSKATLSISQAGYNTCLDVLRANVPALLVPFAKNGEDEQRRRALRLQELGAVKVLDQKDLSPARLAAEIRELMSFKVQRPPLDLNGAEKSAQLIESRLGNLSFSASSAA